MRIAYLTLDDVNLDLAGRLADQCGLALCPLALQDSLYADVFDALLLDWDYLPAVERQQILHEPFILAQACPVAVHSYNLGDWEDEALRRSGVAVFQRLEEDVFRALCQAVSLKECAGGGDEKQQVGAQRQHPTTVACTRTRRCRPRSAGRACRRSGPPRPSGSGTGSSSH